MAFRPYAARAAAHALNTRIVDGDSAWARQNGERWPHRLVPFGARVCFMRSLIYAKEVPTFGAKAIP
eukprot:2882061-Alexandrium_andersonii.AAC.1